MQLIKDKQIIDDTWQYLDDGEAIIAGNISVSVNRWLTEQEELLQHDGNLGIRIEPTCNLEQISDDLEKFNLIELHFPVFTDGRSFSQAKNLRNNYHYKGEIRATGNFMLDQIFYLSRVGVNAFKLENNEKLLQAIATLSDFTVSYQEPTT